MHVTREAGIKRVPKWSEQYVYLYSILAPPAELRGNGMLNMIGYLLIAWLVQNNENIPSNVYRGIPKARSMFHCLCIMQKLKFYYIWRSSLIQKTW